MTTVQTMVTIPADSAIPADAVVNTFCFENVDITTAADLDDIEDALLDFYDSNGGAGSSITSFLGNAQNNAYTVKHYDVDADEPRAPLRTTVLTMVNQTISGSDTLPEEVALCVSFQGVGESGTPQSRRRGRIFLGPFINTVGTITPLGRPAATLIVTVKNAADRLLGTSNAAGWFWAVFSRPKLATVNKNGSPNPARAGNAVRVDNGWVDNAWDTQRRRGLKPTSRDTFVSP